MPKAQWYWSPGWCRFQFNDQLTATLFNLLMLTFCPVIGLFWLPRYFLLAAIGNKPEIMRQRMPKLRLHCCFTVANGINNLYFSGMCLNISREYIDFNTSPSNKNHHLHNNKTISTFSLLLTYQNAVELFLKQIPKIKCRYFSKRYCGLRTEFCQSSPYCTHAKSFVVTRLKTMKNFRWLKGFLIKKH